MLAQVSPVYKLIRTQFCQVKTKTSKKLFVPSTLLNFVFVSHGNQPTLIKNLEVFHQNMTCPSSTTHAWRSSPFGTTGGPQ